MLAELFLILLGCLAGTLTGLVPGLHINAVALLLIHFFPEAGLPAVLFIVSMSLVHSFVDFIPGVLFGAPDSETFLSTLPGHRLLLQGEGFQALGLTVFGGFFGLLFSLLLLPFYSLALNGLSPWIAWLVPWVLLSAVGLMIFFEKGWKTKGKAVVVIVLSGLMGFMVLRGLLPASNGLFVVITGLFGSSTLLYSLKQKPCLKPQNFSLPSIDFLPAAGYALLSSLAGMLVSIFPGIGASQAAFIARAFVGRISSKNYLVLLGGINTANIVFAFFALYFLGKARTGVAAAVQELMPLSLETLFFFVGALMVASLFAVVVSLSLSKTALSFFQRVDYGKINFFVLGLIVLLVGLLSNPFGFLVFLVASAIGLYSLASGVKRSQAMAFLILPVLAFYLGF
jgi:putative membrane protein